MIKMRAMECVTIIIMYCIRLIISQWYTVCIHVYEGTVMVVLR